MDRLLLVCLGGALGSGARFAVGSWAAAAFGPDLPAGTLVVNLGGSFLLAAVMELSLRTAAIPPRLRLFLTTGTMGGFTTYSSFNWELLGLAQGGRAAHALLYLASTVVGCLAAGACGIGAARWIARPRSDPAS